MSNCKTTFHDYLDDKIKLETWQKLGVIFLVIVISGIFGWVYEFIFYFFNGGMKEFYLQGGNFLPWINIYAIGACLIILTTYKIKKHPILVVVISAIATGILEYLAGLLIFKIGNGTRFWDYNTEILNFGNIGGFVCLRSVLFFGISALALMYGILPFCIHLSLKLPKKVFLTIAISLFVIFMADELYNLVVVRIFDLPNAMTIYKSAGFKYVGS